MTPKQTADKIMDRWGLPDSEDVFRAIIEYAFQEGFVQGSQETGQKMLKAFEAGMSRVSTTGK